MLHQWGVLARQTFPVRFPDNRLIELRRGVPKCVRTTKQNFTAALLLFEEKGMGITADTNTNTLAVFQ